MQKTVEDSKKNIVTVRLSEKELKRLEYIREYLEALGALSKGTTTEAMRYILNSFFDSLKEDIKRRRERYERR